MRLLRRIGYNWIVEHGTHGVFEDLLASLPVRRRIHSSAVGRKVALNARMLSPHLRADVMTAAALHDIGYAYPMIGFHPIDGARFLADMGFSRLVCHLVAHHTASTVEAEERGLSLALFDEFGINDSALFDPIDVGHAHGVLWWADLTTGRDGEDVDVKDRLDEICARYGPNDPVTRFVERARATLLVAGQLPIGSIQVPVSSIAY